MLERALSLPPLSLYVFTSLWLWLPHFIAQTCAAAGCCGLSGVADGNTKRTLGLCIGAELAAGKEALRRGAFPYNP